MSVQEVGRKVPAGLEEKSGMCDFVRAMMRNTRVGSLDCRGGVGVESH